VYEKKIPARGKQNKFNKIPKTEEVIYSNSIIFNIVLLQKLVKKKFIYIY